MYHPVILRHNQHPVGFEKRPEAQHIVQAYNPLCGDKFSLALDIEHGAIAHATFHGYGCAISKASTSVLVEKIRGKTLAEARQILENFLCTVETGSPVPTDDETAAFAEARQFPGRMDCATLAWRALAEAGALKGGESVEEC